MTACETMLKNMQGWNARNAAAQFLQNVKYVSYQKATLLGTKVLVSTLTVHFVSSTDHIGAPYSFTDCSPSISLYTLLFHFTLFFNVMDPYRTTTEHVSCGQWHCSNTDLVVMCIRSDCITVKEPYI